MKPFNGRIGKKIPKDIVSDLRFFGFYIGNETLMLPEITDLSVIYEDPDAIGNLYAIKLFSNYDKIGNRINYPQNGSSNMKDYVISLKTQEHFILPAEMENVGGDLNWRSCIVRFILDFGNRRIDAEPLKNLQKDYCEDFIDYGNSMEMMIAIFTNVLRMDNQWNAINEKWARYRTSQYIRMYHDDAFDIVPPFKEWEQCLYL